MTHARMLHPILLFALAACGASESVQEKESEQIAPPAAQLGKVVVYDTTNTGHLWMWGEEWNEDVPRRRVFTFPIFPADSQPRLVFFGGCRYKVVSPVRFAGQSVALPRFLSGAPKACGDWKYGEVTVAEDIFRRELTDATRIQVRLHFDRFEKWGDVPLRRLRQQQWKVERNGASSYFSSVDLGQFQSHGRLEANKLTELNKLEPVAVAVLKALKAARSVGIKVDMAEIAYDFSSRHHEWAEWYDALSPADQARAALVIAAKAARIAPYLDRQFLDRYLLGLTWEDDILPVDPQLQQRRWPHHNDNKVIPFYGMSYNDLYLRLWWQRRGEVLFETVQASVARSLGVKLPAAE